MKTRSVKSAKKRINDRSLVSSHLVGFLLAFRQAIALHQHFVDSSRGVTADVSKLVLSQLTIFSVRALETLFRDCFVHVAEHRPGFAASAAAASRGALTEKDAAILSLDIAVQHEILAARSKLQDLDTVSDAFGPVFGSSVLDSLATRRFFIYRMHEGRLAVASCTLSDLAPAWRSDIHRLFAARHEIIHNAHSPLPTDQIEVVRQANAALLFGQFFATAIGEILDAGVLCIRAPRAVVETIAAQSLARDAQRARQELPHSAAANNLARWRGIVGRDGSAYIGPFVFFWNELARARFSPHAKTGSQLAYAHAVDIEEDGTFKVETLWRIHDSGSASDPVGGA